MRLIRIAPILSIALVIPSAVLAQSEQKDEPTPPVTTEGAEPPVQEAKPGPPSIANYPKGLIDRPLTLPKFGLQVTGDFSILVVNAGSGSADAEGFGLGATLIGGSLVGLLSGLPNTDPLRVGGLGVNFGVTDQLQVGAATAFVLHPFDSFWSKTLELRAAYLVYDSDKLDVAPGASLLFNFNPSPNSLFGVALGANARFLLTDQLYLIGGNNLITFGVDPGFMSFELNGGVGFQILPQLAVQATTQLFHLKIAGDFNRSLGFIVDEVPISVSGLYAINNQFDVFVSIFDDLRHPGDFFAIFGGVNFRLGITPPG
jgi:hypothetical protein